MSVSDRQTDRLLDGDTDSNRRFSNVACCRSGIVACRPQVVWQHVLCSPIHRPS